MVCAALRIFEREQDVLYVHATPILTSASARVATSPPESRAVNDIEINSKSHHSAELKKPASAAANRRGMDRVAWLATCAPLNNWRPECRATFSTTGSQSLSGGQNFRLIPPNVQDSVSAGGLSSIHISRRSRRGPNNQLHGQDDGSRWIFASEQLQ